MPKARFTCVLSLAEQYAQCATAQRSCHQKLTHSLGGPVREAAPHESAAAWPPVTGSVRGTTAAVPDWAARRRDGAADLPLVRLPTARAAFPSVAAAAAVRKVAPVGVAAAAAAAVVVAAAAAAVAV